MACRWEVSLMWWDFHGELIDEFMGVVGVRVRFGFCLSRSEVLVLWEWDLAVRDFICHLMTLSFRGKSWSARDCSEFICYLLS